MKIIKLAILVLLPLLSKAQDVEVIQDEVRQTAYQSKSYLVIKSLTIKPPSGGGSFTFTATNENSFFIRVADAANQPLNPPPSLDQNFVRTESVLVPGITSEDMIYALPVEQKSTSFSYVDGMARALQSTTVQGSPSKADVIQPVKFDVNGRQPLEYLPYANATADGRYHAAATSAEQAAFYTSPPAGVSGDSRPYKENIFEASPLNRPVTVYGPGADWQVSADKPVTNLLKVNLASENIIKWKDLRSTYPEKDGTYANNQLSVEQTTDEDGKIKRVYKNLRGQVILSRAGDGTTWFDTYSIYSPLGNLAIVIQPEGVNRLGAEFDAGGADKQSFLDRWCFQYQYDDEQRQIAKRIPGWNGWQYTVYDIWSRAVLTQTPAQKDRDEWTFTKYDAFSRAIVTGLYSSSSSQSAMQSTVNSYNSSSNRYETQTAGTIGYTQSNCFPVNPSDADVYTITYYDNYDFITNLTLGSAYDFVDITGFPHWSGEILQTSAKGYATGSKIKILGTSTWLTSATWYDKKYRVVQVTGDNYLSGRDRVTTSHDFTGKALATQLYHTSSVTSLTALREFEYDHGGRLLKLYQTTGSGDRVLMASNKYNEVGQLIEKNIHSTDGGANFLQSVDMRYNIRGWLSSINNSGLSNDGSLNNDANDVFGMELMYNPSSSPSVSGYPGGGTVPKFYNGNISAIKWKSDTKQTGVTPVEQIYGFDYDGLSRLKGAYYAANNSGAWSGSAGMFNEQISSYDGNGNISNLVRSGKVDGAQTTIDNLTYGYTLGSKASNRLVSVSDANGIYGYKDGANATEEYQYDASGNLNYDLNKEISGITYNHLNLPTIIEFTRPETGGSIDRMIYTYDANGTKLRSEVYKNGTVGSNGTLVWTTDYAGEFQYDKKGSDAKKLSFASTPEGRVLANDTGFDYEYFYKDHQGNVRLTYGELKETVSYRATMEDPASPSTLGDDEEATFLNLSSTRYQQGPGENFNYTKSSDLVLAPDRSSLTNAFLGKPIGMAKSLHLGSGDKVRMEVYATFKLATGSTSTIAASALVTALATTTFGFGSGEAAYSTFNANAPLISGIDGATTTVPKAYLAYLFFNDSYAFVSSGAVSVGTGAHDAFQKLERTFTAGQSGYLYVYVTNESNVSSTNGSVYFDEMLIVHEKNNSTLQVTQANDYYPFGLAFNTYQAERINEDNTPVLKNRYGFQGQELQKDLDLGWSQFKWRMHDPAIGRFGGVDPLSDKYLHNSTYAFSENRVVRHIELEGLEATDPFRMWNYQVWRSVGLPYKPNETTSRDIGLTVAKTLGTAYITPIAVVAPVEEVGLAGAMYFVGRATSTLRTIRVVNGIEELLKTSKVMEPSLAKGGNAAKISSKESHGLEFLNDGGDKVKTFDKTLSISRSLDNLESLKGATFDEVESLIPSNWIKTSMNKGEGVKYINPNKRGEQILLERGWENATDPLHSGPYLKMSRNGNVDRIPLAGNPTL